MQTKPKKTVLVMGLISSLFVVAGAHAEGVAVNASVGSTGLGLHASLPLKTNINLRLGVNYMKLSTVMKDPDGDTNVDVTLNTFDALLDWFPQESTFRVTGGLVYNGNKIDTVTKLQGATFNGTTFNIIGGGSLGQVDGNIKGSNVINPYIGIGWGNAVTQPAGWGFTSDIGLLFHGTPQATLINTGCTAGPFICGQVASKVKEEEDKLNAKLSNMIAFPVVRIGASYKF